MKDSRVVVTDSGELLSPAVERLREAGVQVEVLVGGDTDRKVAACRTADAVLVGVSPLTGEEIDAFAGRVGLVVRCGVGYEIIDLEAAAGHAIRVANVPDYCTDEVADHTMALLLAAARRVPHFLTSWQLSKTWDWSGDDQAVPRLADLTLGLIGAGRIGRAVARRAAGFGMRILASDPAPPPGVAVVDQATLLAESDVVSLHCPHTAQTHHLMNDATLAQLRRGAILINTSRGPVVDGSALVRALERDPALIACLDVLEGEPAPDLAQPLLTHPRVLVTPHVAYFSTASRCNLGIFAAENVLRYLRGEEPINVVNGAAITSAR